MVVQQALDNLKDKPKEDKKAVAAGIAFAVVIVLFFTWAFFFFKKIQSGAINEQLGGGAQDEFNFSSVRDAQQQLMQGFSDTSELRDVRDRSTDSQQSSQYQQYFDSGNGNDAFGGSGSIE